MGAVSQEMSTGPVCQEMSNQEKYAVSQEVSKEVSSPSQGWAEWSEGMGEWSDKLSIKQRINWAEVAGDTLGCDACCEKENEYDVYDGTSGKQLMYISEKSEMCCWGKRCLCKPAHELKLEFAQKKGDPVLLTVDRPFKCMQGCPAWMECCLQEMTATDMKGEVIGRSKQPTCGGWFRPKVGLFAGSNEEAFGTIAGPLCCFGGLTEMCCDQVFNVQPGYGEAEDAPQIAQIVKERPESMEEAMKEVISDSDLLTLRFMDGSLTNEQKMTLLMSVIFLDYLFFEQNQAFDCNFAEMSVTCTICEWYICGALHGITCTCGGGSEDSEGGGD